MDIVTAASEALADDSKRAAALRLCAAAKNELGALVATLEDDTVIALSALEVVEEAVKRAERVCDLYAQVRGARLEGSLAQPLRLPL